MLTTISSNYLITNSAQCIRLTKGVDQKTSDRITRIGWGVLFRAKLFGSAYHENCAYGIL